MKRFLIGDFRLVREGRLGSRRFHSSSFILHPLFGFTILELLTAMAVLALILVMMVQVVNGLLQSTRTQSQQMDSVAAARRALDVITTDLNNAVIGENAAILAPDGAGSSLLALLTSRRGTNGAANHRFLAVSYSTNANSQLIRSHGSVNFGETNLLTGITNATNSAGPLAKGILAIKVLAVADGTNTYALGSAAANNWSTNIYNGFAPPSGYNAIITRAPTFSSGLTNRTRAIEVWVTAVDDQNYTVLEGAGKLAAVRGLLGADPTAWRGAIDNAAIPAQAKSGIRILNKTIPVR
jgi:type II secretory pathway pseudopilin PulG